MMLWSLKDYKIMFLLVGLVGTLVISSPMLLLLVPSQTSEQFSELYILGPNRIAEDYPFNIEAGKTYTIHLGVANHIGAPSHYQLKVKLRNRSESLPNSIMNTPSSLPAIFTYRIFLGDDEVWEKPLTFSMQNISFQGSHCLVTTLSLDGLAQTIEKQIASDQESPDYLVELFFELWLLDAASKTFSFHNRWVGIWLNITCSENTD
jgi:hypothetical protein